MNITQQQRNALEQLIYDLHDKPTAELVCNKIHKILHTQHVPEFLKKRDNVVKVIGVIKHAKR